MAILRHLQGPLPHTNRPKCLLNNTGLIHTHSITWTMNKGNLFPGDEGTDCQIFGSGMYQHGIIVNESITCKGGIHHYTRGPQFITLLIAIVDVRRSLDRLITTMGVPILVHSFIYIGPRPLVCYKQPQTLAIIIYHRLMSMYTVIKEIKMVLSDCKSLGTDMHLNPTTVNNMRWCETVQMRNMSFRITVASFFRTCATLLQLVL